MTAVVLVVTGLTVASWVAAVAILCVGRPGVASEASEAATGDRGGS